MKYLLLPLLILLFASSVTGSLVTSDAVVQGDYVYKVKVLTVPELIKVVFKDKADEAMKIAQCESKMNPEAINDQNSNFSVDSGLFQINSVHWPKIPGEYDTDKIQWLQDARNNTMMAKRIYDAQGFSPWVCAHKLGIV